MGIDMRSRRRAWLAAGLGLWLAWQPLQADRRAPDVHQLQAWQQQWLALPASERSRILAAARWLATQPAEEQARLQQRFQQLDRMHREGWRLGPRVGAHWPGLQPLVGWLPPAQRQPMRAVLWSLADEDLVRLVRLVERTPPEGRNALRRSLLEKTPAQRQAWLRQQVGR